MDKNKTRVYIHSNCLYNLLKLHRIPMLFVGSGLSKRYLKNYPSWDELIFNIAKVIGVNKSQIIAMKQAITDSKPSETQGKINAEIGSNLTKIFRDKIISSELSLSDIFTDEEINLIERKNISFIKMLISKQLSKYEITDNPKYLSELNELKKLQNNIGVVVTTNYDKFLENEIFNNFDVFSEQTQYYMTENCGIGEIYKIHGSVDIPSSIIFNSDDYNNFRSNLKVVAAKLLNLVLEYPIIFIGYSLEDENVLEILYTVIDSLNPEQLRTLSKNLIYVNWKKGTSKLKETEETITRDGKSLKMTCINTDNYFVLYKHLQKFLPAERPERVRKYKKMIRNLVIKSNGGQATIIADSNIDKLNNENRLVVAFGETEQFAIKGIVGMSAKELINLVLEQKSDFSESYAESIFKSYFLTTKVSKTQFVPIFYLFKFCKGFRDNEKVINMKNNLQTWIDKINNNNNIPLYESSEEISDHKGDLAEYKYLSCISKAYSNDKINYEECLNLLKEYIKSNSSELNTHFRKAITYLDMKVYYSS